MEKTINFNGKWYSERSLKSLLRKEAIKSIIGNSEYESIMRLDKKTNNPSIKETRIHSIINEVVKDTYNTLISKSLKISNN